MACGHSNVSKSVKHTLHATSTHTNRDRRRPHRQQIRKLNGINLNEFRSLCVFVTDQNRQTPYGGREKFSILNLRLFFYSISTHIHRKYIFSNSHSERTFDVPEQFCKHQIHGIWPYSPQNIINITITWYLYSISSERRANWFLSFLVEFKRNVNLPRPRRSNRIYWFIIFDILLCKTDVCNNISCG